MSKNAQDSSIKGTPIHAEISLDLISYRPLALAAPQAHASGNCFPSNFPSCYVVQQGFTKAAGNTNWQYQTSNSSSKIQIRSSTGVVSYNPSNPDWFNNYNMYGPATSFTLWLVVDCATYQPIGFDQNISMYNPSIHQHFWHVVIPQGTTCIND